MRPARARGGACRLRADVRSCTASRCRWPRARSSRCSEPTAPARRRRCARSAAASDGTATSGSPGRSLRRMSTEDIVRRGIAHVPEGRGILTELTVDENLRLGAHLRRDGAAGAQGLRPRVRVLPGPARTPQPLGQHALRRRAADARRRAGTPDASTPDAARRAVARPRPAGRARDLRHHPRHQPQPIASRSCWSSRTPDSRSTCRAMRTCWRWAASPSTGLSADLKGNDSVRRSYLGY